MNKAIAVMKSDFATVPSEPFEGDVAATVANSCDATADAVSAAVK